MVYILVSEVVVYKEVNLYIYMLDVFDLEFDYFFYLMFFLYNVRFFFIFYYRGDEY